MKNKKIINFAKIGLSLIFLFNPNVNIIDILPDFIGYILLCSALISLSDMNETVAEAYSAFKRLILIDGAKWLAILWVFGISVISERNSSLMLWSFTFGLLEIIFVIPAFLKLFEGITSLGYLHENSSVLASARRGKRSFTDKARGLTVFFILLKAVMSFLPELSDLTSTEYYENAGLTNLYQYIGIMRLLAFIPVLIVGVIWVIKINRYFSRINKDTSFVAALEEIYTQRVANKKGIFIKRNVAISFFVLLTAFAFSFDFRLERVNMLPDFICGILLVVFFVVASKKTKLAFKLPCAVSVAYTAVSAVAYVAEAMFFAEYTYSAVDRAMDARNAFVAMAAVSTVSTVLFAAVCILAFKAIKQMIDTHTGAVSVSGEYTEKQASMTAAIHKELYMAVYWCLAALAAYCVTDILYIWLAKDFTFMFFINVLGAAMFVYFSFKMYFEISEAVESRYMLE